MDRDHFDAIARILSAARSRRGALALVAAGPLALLAHAGSAEAKRR